MSPSDAIRLRHMLEAAQEALDHAAGGSRSDLAGNRVLALALIKCIEIIGEAAARVSAETQASYPQIPWIDIVGMRNRLVHVYFDIDLDRLHDTIVGDLPELIAVLSTVVRES